MDDQTVDVFDIVEQDKKIISNNNLVCKYINPIITGRYYFNGRRSINFENYCSRAEEKRKRLGL